jgi:hypothetical protein
MVGGSLRTNKACVFSRIVTVHFQSERSDVFQRLFFFSLSKDTGLCRAIVLAMAGGAHWKREAGGPRKRAMFLVFTS